MTIRKKLRKIHRVRRSAPVVSCVYEVEEETSTIPVNDAPSKPTAKATPARYPRHGLSSRSNSPHKRSAPVQLGVEEKMITRAARAAQRSPARRDGRGVSPPPADDYTKTMAISETVTAIPGQNGVPTLPKGANGSFEPWRWRMAAAMHKFS